ncbi:MAG: hypothetical protein OEY36_07105 [Gammaproteobacteria bacterium]|nr:hypothetical protein [Gammaproteobacteria bacterium]
MRLNQIILLLVVFSISPLASSNNTTCPRIISQSPYISKMLDYLGLGECIVGVSRYSKRQLPHTGGILDPDAEAIDSLMPDLFITSDWTSLETIEKIIPEKVKSIRLSSFNTMNQLEDNMAAIIKATNWQQANDKVRVFAQSWRNKVKQVQGNHKKVLLLSSCSGSAYSFGPDSRLYDLFTLAGFNVLESGRKIRHIRPGNEIEDLTRLLNHYQPDLLFIFEQTLTKQCQMLFPNKAVRILNFDGKLFLHPTTAILDGLDSLILQKHSWQ